MALTIAQFDSLLNFGGVAVGEERYVVTVADVQTDFSIDAEGDHFGVINDPSVRIKAMAFEKDGVTPVILVVANKVAYDAIIGTTASPVITGAYNPA